MSQYRLIFTNIGLSKKQNAELNNDYIEITQFAVGSVNIVSLLPTMTGILQEEYRADINNVDTKNGVTIFDLIVPSSVGGFYIKEVALFDVDGDCICIGTVPITYKVNQNEGASKSIHLKVSTTSTNTENIVFNTDDSLVYATVSYVDNSVSILRNEILLELPKKVNVLDIKNGLTYTDIDKPLSAYQGKVLKQYIDSINTLLGSDNTTLDDLQEIVDFIELNRETLNTLGITNIAGLQNALNGKLSTTGTAADSAKLIGKNWIWSEQAGQATWFFGTDGGADFHLYNPSNFNVNYANSAGSANYISPTVAGNANAGLGTGSVGSYAFLTLGTSGGQIAAGSLYSGSSLFYSGVAEDVYNHGQAYDYLWKGNGTTGTWRAMGDSQNSGVYEATLFLRIA